MSRNVRFCAGFEKFSSFSAAPWAGKEISASVDMENSQQRGEEKSVLLPI
jgi:hypothetical protein